MSVTFSYPTISRTKIFLAAAIFVMVPVLAHADITTSVNGNVVKHYNFNSDTGVKVGENGTVATGTAVKNAALNSMLQAQVEEELPASALDMNAGTAASASASAQMPHISSSLTGSNLESQVTIPLAR